MRKTHIVLLIIVIASFLTGCVGKAVAQSDEVTPASAPEKTEPTATSEVVSKNPPASCPVTTPAGQDSLFSAPAPFSPSAPWEGFFWFGSNGLWTALRTDGVWAELPHNPDGYTQKITWWSDFYSLPDEPEPALVVIGRRLDADAPPLGFYGATNAMADDIGEAMPTGVDFPTLGCWEVRGEYKKTELVFVVWVRE